MADITVALPSGESVTVAADALTLPEGTGLYGGDFGAPEGFTASDRFEAELERRADSKITKAGYLKPEDAYADDALRKQLAKRGIELDDEFKPIGKLTPEQREAIANAIREDEVAPLQTKYQEATTALESLKSEKLRLDLRGEMGDDLKATAFKPVVPGVPSQFDAIVANLVKRDDDGKPYFEGEGGIPDYNVSDALRKHIKKHAPDLLEDKRQRGAGLDGSPGGGGTKQMTRSQFDALSPDARMAFVKGGGKIVDG